MDIWEKLKAKRKTETILDMLNLKCKDYKYNDNNECYYCYFNIKNKSMRFTFPLYTQEWFCEEIDYIVSKIKKMIEEMSKNG